MEGTRSEGATGHAGQDSGEEGGRMTSTNSELCFEPA